MVDSSCFFHPNLRFGVVGASVWCCSYGARMRKDDGTMSGR